MRDRTTALAPERILPERQKASTPYPFCYQQFRRNKDAVAGTKNPETSTPLHLKRPTVAESGSRIPHHNAIGRHIHRFIWTRNPTTAMSRTLPIYILAIQPPSMAPPSGLLFPPPTLLFFSPCQNSPFSLTPHNLLAIASLVPASIDFSVSDDLAGLTGDNLTGTLTVPATPLSDGSGVAFVFRNLSVERIGHWRIRITVLRKNEERDRDEGAVVEPCLQMAEGAHFSGVLRLSAAHLDMTWGDQEGGRLALMTVALAMTPNRSMHSVCSCPAHPLLYPLWLRWRPLIYMSS